MSKTQRAALKLLLLFDVAMLLYPPYERGVGFYRRNIGYDWLFFSPAQG
jgi:hypothetical protein